MLGKRPCGLQRSTSTSHVIEMAATSTAAATANACPPKERARARARPPEVAIPLYNSRLLPKESNNDIHYDKLASPRSPLSVLQCLLTNYFSRKAETGEPKTGVGLSIVIDNFSHSNSTLTSPSFVSKMQILNKSMQVAARCKDSGFSKQKSVGSSLPVVYNENVFLSPLPAIDFLDACYLCKRSLGPGKDIYMYRGDRAFCSVECRWQQILADERNEKCSSAAIKPVTATPSRRSEGHGHRTRGPGTAMATVG